MTGAPIDASIRATESPKKDEGHIVDSTKDNLDPDPRVIMDAAEEPPSFTPVMNDGLGVNYADLGEDYQGDEVTDPNDPRLVQEVVNGQEAVLNHLLQQPSFQDFMEWATAQGLSHEITFEDLQDFHQTILSSGLRFVCGTSTIGMLGTGVNSDVSQTLSSTSEVTNYKYINASGAVVFGIDFSGKLFSWGQNLQGQLGQGISASVFVRNAPFQITTPNRSWVKVMSAAGSHALALATTGELFETQSDGNWHLFRSNVKDFSVRFGQLGFITTSGQLHSYGGVVDSSTVWKAVAPNMAIRENGQLFNFTDETLGTQIGTDTDWKDIRQFRPLSETLNVALKEDGTLWSWGSAPTEWQGRGVGASPEATPHQIGSDTDWASLLDGDGGTGAIKQDNRCFVWGPNTGFRTGQGSASGTLYDPQELVSHCPAGTMSLSNASHFIRRFG